MKLRFYASMGTAVLCSLLTFNNATYGAKDLVKMRQERLEKAEAEWSRERKSLNVHYRLPVMDAVGYLAMNVEDASKLQQLLENMKPFSERAKEIINGPISGSGFPGELDRKLSKAREEMYQEIAAIYGKNAANATKQFLKQKYDFIGNDIFSALR